MAPQRGWIISSGFFVRTSGSAKEASGTGDGAGYFKKSFGHFLSNTLKERYEFIRDHENFYPVKILCKAMQLSRSAYYQYLEVKGPNAKEQQLEEVVVEVFQEHRRRYGVRRVCREMKERGFRVGKEKCGRVLKKNGLKAIQPRSFVPKTTQSRHPYRISPNLLVDRPAPVKPCEVWVGDITYIALCEGRWAYLSVWMDLYSRKITG